jgi:hypothetical protein
MLLKSLKFAVALTIGAMVGIIAAAPANTIHCTSHYTVQHGDTCASIQHKFQPLHDLIPSKFGLLNPGM